jgi:hypothetical protein
MLPSSSTPSGPDKGSNLRRWGPIIGIVAVLALIAVVVIVSSGGDDDTASPGTTAAAPGTSTGDTTGGTEGPNGTAPPDSGSDAISFSEAEALGLDVTFPETCDLERGQVAIPNFFAPECYANVDDNGGATDTGVTADTIKIGLYSAPETDPVLDFILGSIQSDDTSAQAVETVQGFVDMFNATYQTYGRRVELEVIQGSGSSTDEAAARADAIRAADAGVFAVWGTPALNSAWTEELNARGIPCIGCFGVPDPEPNVFTITASTDQTRVQLVEYISKKLAGKPAVHAGDEAFQTQERNFGMLWLQASEASQQEADETVAALAAEGVTISESVPFDLTRASEQATGIIQRFKDAGVTSIIISGDPSTPAIFTQAATDQEYFPEWIIGGSALMDTTAFARTYDQEQWAHAFGISSLTARLAPDVVGSAQELYTWFNGTEPPADDSVGVLLPAPQVFFNALQEAGPNLTVESFEAALLSIAPGPASVTEVRFSYGDHGLYPTIEGEDHAGIDDFTEIWYDPNVTGVVDEIGHDGTGAYQYVDGGRRYLPGEWTDEDKAFDPEGAVAIYDSPPEGEAAPDYPSPAGGG